MELKNIENFEEWDKWKKTLAKAVNIGEAVGISQNTIENIGVRVGNILSSSVDPENREQRVLQELWKVGDDNDKKALSHMIVRMVKEDDRNI